MHHPSLIIIAALFGLSTACDSAKTLTTSVTDNDSALRPVIITQKVFDDSDDPAIWINPLNADSSLVIGTDKHKDKGGLFVFDLNGKIDSSKCVLNLKRTNNVDVQYGLPFNNGKVDIAVCTERDRNAIRVFALPSMTPIDGGGIQVFNGQKDRLPMGIALYKRPADGSIYAIVGRKWGPADGYLEQYLLRDNGAGQVTGELVRSFGKFSGIKEIEALAVDNELGYVYYCDEGAGIHKYYADPSKGNEELVTFGLNEFKDDNEGISIYKLDDGTGYILVSDQAANRFNIYPREGAGPGNPHEHALIATLPFSTSESDGSEVTSASLPGFEGGLFVAMSTDGTFQYYKWTDIAKRAGLKIKTNLRK